MTLRGVWSGIGTICCSVMLQVANQKYPTFYRLPLYVCWGLSCLMLAGILVIPESPWFYARHGRKEEAMKSLQRLYGGLAQFDPEEAYGIIERTLVIERSELDIQKAAAWRELFSGNNLRRTAITASLHSGLILAGLSLVNTYNTCES